MIRDLRVCTTSICQKSIFKWIYYVNTWYPFCEEHFNWRADLIEDKSQIDQNKFILELIHEN